MYFLNTYRCHLVKSILKSNHCLFTSIQNQQHWYMNKLLTRRFYCWFPIPYCVCISQIAETSRNHHVMWELLDIAACVYEILNRMWNWSEVNSSNKLTRCCACRLAVLFCEPVSLHNKQSMRHCKVSVVWDLSLRCRQCQCPLNGRLMWRDCRCHMSPLSVHFLLVCKIDKCCCHVKNGKIIFLLKNISRNYSVWFLTILVIQETDNYHWYVKTLKFFSCWRIFAEHIVCGFIVIHETDNCHCHAKIQNFFSCWRLATELIVFGFLVIQETDSCCCYLKNSKVLFLLKNICRTYSVWIHSDSWNRQLPLSCKNSKVLLLLKTIYRTYSVWFLSNSRNWQLPLICENSKVLFLSKNICRTIVCGLLVIQETGIAIFLLKTFCYCVFEEQILWVSS